MYAHLRQPFVYMLIETIILKTSCKKLERFKQFLQIKKEISRGKMNELVYKHHYFFHDGFLYSVIFFINFSVTN